MPEKRTIQRAKKAGKAPSAQAEEFVRQEVKPIRKKKRGARSAKKASATGLSKARKAGVRLKSPRKGKLSKKRQKSAKAAHAKGQRKKPISRKRSVARKKAPRTAASRSRAVKKAARSRK